jgi:hypothetical protein
MKEFFLQRQRSILFFFIVGLVVRIVYLLLTYKESYTALPDSYAYDDMSSRFLAGDFDFNRKDFIIAPLYLLVLALFKLIFGAFWLQALIAFQVIISACTVFYVWKLAELLFSSVRVAAFASLIYCFYVPLFYFISVIAQETIFLFLLIGFIFHFVRFLNTTERRDMFIAGCFFAAAYFTKSFVNLFVPFLIFLVFYLCKSITIRERIVSLALFFSTAVILAIPVGIHNYNKSGMFVTSSNGGGVVFFMANSNVNYLDVTDSDTSNAARFPNGRKVFAFSYFPNPTYDSIMNLPDKQKEKALWDGGFKWIKENKEKFLTIRAINFFRMLMPGNSLSRYPFKLWLGAFIFSFPLYLLAYIGIIKSLKAGFKKHLWILAWIVAISIMHIMFIFTNRYRTYTYDIFYIVYASFTIDILIKWFKSRRTSVA